MDVKVGVSVERLRKSLIIANFLISELDKYYAVWDYGRQTAEVLNSKNEVVEQLGIVLGDTQLPQ